MSTYTTDKLSGPARLLVAHARQTMALKSHRETIAAWLTKLNLGAVEELFAAAGSDGTAATSLLITEHRNGSSVATTILLAAKARMLAAVCRHAPGDDYSERFQITVDAFLSVAVARAKINHPHLNAQLYWVTLRSVHNQHQAPAEVAVEPEEMRDVAGPDVVVDLDEHLTASIVLDWAQSKGLLNDQDRQALDVRFGGSTVLPVREVAHRLDLSEDGLETRLRRAIRRIRDGVSTDEGHLSQACLESLWPTVDDADPAAATEESSLVA
jgi:DNA-directed RNA polymerase specialized sigma24 family protein